MCKNEILKNVIKKKSLYVSSVESHYSSWSIAWHMNGSIEKGKKKH